MKSAEPEKNLPGENLDGLMKAYFRREMPAPWPRSPHPAKSRVSPHGEMPAPWSSRWALALALSVFLASLTLIPTSRPSDYSTGSTTITTVGEAMAGSRPNLGSPSRSRKLRLERRPSPLLETIDRPAPGEIHPSTDSARGKK
ncbi:MAG: hypothetical protein ACKO23_18595 [Gemmataceae bacterium]